MDQLSNLEIAEWIPLAVGVVFLLFGWFLYWFSIHLAGGTLVGGVGLLLAGTGARQFDLTEGQAIALMAGGAVLGAIVGFLLARVVHALALFLLGCISGSAIFFAVMSAVRAHVSDGFFANDAFFAFGIPTAGALMGLLAVAFSKTVTIIVTAILGAALVMVALDWPYAGLPMIPLALGGAIVQLAIARPWRKREEEEED